MASELALQGAGEYGEIAEVKWTEAEWAIFDKLTQKQKAFIWEYPKDFNSTKAAKRAGYAGNEHSFTVTGSRLLRHPKVNPLIRSLTAATADELGITREWLLNEIQDVAAKAKRGAPKFLGTEGTIARDENGEVVYEWSPQGAARALELLAKLRGDMIERKEIDMKVVSMQLNGVEVVDVT